MRLTKGNEFKVNELFGDQQAYLALKPLMENKALYDQWLKEILNNSAGTVDADYKFLHNLPKERADRRGAALEASGARAGGWWDSFTSPIKEHFVRLINPDYANSERAYEREQYYSNVNPRSFEKEIKKRERQLKKLPKPKLGDIDLLGTQRDNLQQQIEALRQELETIRHYQPDSFDLGKKTGKIPIPAQKPIGDKLGGDLGPEADKAMEGYNKRLAVEADKAVKIVGDAVSAIKAILNFTASPTIVPNVSTPAGPPTPASSGEKHSSIVNNTGVRLSQNIRSNNPRQAARLAARESERAIQRAMANSFHDTGRRLT